MQAGVLLIKFPLPPLTLARKNVLLKPIILPLQNHIHYPLNI